MDDRRIGPSLRRWRETVGTWWFPAAATVLLVNDHVLKHRHPGWVTGKVSDVAGPLVVAALVATVLGRRAAVAVTAVAFTILKTVPGAAELVAPVLGGVTRRDATDLVGLVGLVPLWIGSTRGGVVEAPSPIRVAATWRHRVLPVCGPVVAVVALTATSQPNPPEVRSLATDGTTIYAEVGLRGSYAATDVSWAASTDGGRRWEPAAAPDPAALTAMVRSREEVCRSDGSCLAARGATVDEHDGDGSWQPSYRLSGDQADVLAYRRFGSGTPVDELFTGVLVAPRAEGEAVLVAASDQGVLRRTGAGWERMAVLGASPTPTSGATWPLDLAGAALLASAPISFVALSSRALTRGGGGARMAGSLVGAALVGLAIWSVGVGVWLVGTFTARHPVLLAGALFVLAAAVVAVPLGFVKTVGRDIAG
jgi:hypothetical protein